MVPRNRPLTSDMEAVRSSVHTPASHGELDVNILDRALDEALEPSVVATRPPMLIQRLEMSEGVRPLCAGASWSVRLMIEHNMIRARPVSQSVHQTLHSPCRCDRRALGRETCVSAPFILQSVVRDTTPARGSCAVNSNVHGNSAMPAKAAPSLQRHTSSAVSCLSSNLALSI